MSLDYGSHGHSESGQGGLICCSYAVMALRYLSNSGSKHQENVQDQKADQRQDNEMTSSVTYDHDWPKADSNGRRPRKRVPSSGAIKPWIE